MAKSKTAVEWLIDQLKGRYDIDIEKLMVCAAAKEIEREKMWRERKIELEKIRKKNVNA